MNRLTFIGNLGNDATVKEVNSKTVINFSIAHTEKWKDAQGNLKEKTTWLACARWGDNAAVAPYLTKGTKVAVVGDVEAEAYKNAAGEAMATLKMNVRELELLGSATGATQAAQPAAQAGPPPPPPQPVWNAAKGVYELPAATAQPQYQQAPLPVDNLPF